ncbi:hypothetical protein Tco_1174074 [Tanacetum coccineum]
MESSGSWLRKNAAGMLNTCKSDGKWCFQWQTLTKAMTESWSREDDLPHLGLRHGQTPTGGTALGNFSAMAKA